MTASYRLINYTLRPAKFAERKMLVEALACLKVFGSLRTYRYVGFGSIWYADCVLFHRSLGIEQIISIEREESHEDRFKFNKPYGGIDLRMGEAATVLPNLDWDHRSIVWLDYDDPLSPSILDDVRTVSTRACPGTALIVSVNTEKILDKRNLKSDPIHVTEHKQLQSFFGVARTPSSIRKANLEGWGLSSFSRRIIQEEIESGLQKINEARAIGQHIKFRQIVAFEYADGAKMTTIGGVFIDAGQEALFSSSGLTDLSFFRNGSTALRINVPLLTPREIHQLEQSLPLNSVEEKSVGFIPISDSKRYENLYRYLPKFASYEP